MWYFDPTNKGFYSSSLHKKLPAGCIGISDEEYRTFALSCNPVGCMVGVVDGKIGWETIGRLDKPSGEPAKAKERSWRDAELSRADIELYKIQDSDPKSMGSDSDAQWREYRKALRVWPEHKDFPNKKLRPVAPDA